MVFKGCFFLSVYSLKMQFAKKVNMTLENIVALIFQEMWKYQVDYWFWWHINLSVDYSFLNQKGKNIFREKNMILLLKIAQYSKSSIDEQYLSTFLIALKACFLKQKVIPTVLLLLIYFDFGPIRWNIS